MAVEPEREDLGSALREAGHRLTRPRRAIVDVLQSTDESLSPEEIYHRAKARYGALGMATVYRTLEVLAEIGMVRRVHTRDRCHGYASASEERHYVVCTRCGRVEEFLCEGMRDYIRRVERRTGYRIANHLLEFSGLCPDCQRDVAE